MGYLKVKEVLVHKPGSELKIVSMPKRYLFSDFIDMNVMQKEHDLLVRTLYEQGIAIHYLKKSSPSKPKLYVIRDNAVILNKKAVTTHSIHSIRRGEEQIVKQRLRELGIKITGHIFVPGFLKGSDIFIIDKDKAYARMGQETNEKAVEYLSDLLKVEVIPIDIGGLPNTHVNFIDNIVVISEQVLDYPIYELIKEKELDMVTANKKQTQEMAINFIKIGDNKIINVKSDLNRKLRMIGYDVIEVDLKELTKGHCGIRNMVLPLH